MERPWIDSGSRVREAATAPAPPDPLGDLDQVYHSYAPLLRNIAMRKFDIPVGDAEAIVHDVFATFIATQSRVFNVRAYLIAAVCQASKRYRHHRRGEEPLTGAEMSCEMDDAEIEAVAARMTLAATLERLNPRCREILRRRYLQDESTEVIADGMRMKPDNVLYVLHGCRKRAREMYDELTKVRR